MQIDQNIMESTLPQIQVEKPDLLRAFNACALVTERKIPQPILGNSRIVSNGLKAFITATDLDLQLTCAIPCNGDSRARFTVPTHALQSFVKSAPDCGNVTITSPQITYYSDIETRAESQIIESESEFKFGKLVYSCGALPETEFPIMESKAFTHKFLISGADLFESIDSTMFAVSQEDTRYYLNGIYMAYEAGEILFVATDGHRLAHKALERPDSALDDMPPAIIPTKAIKVLHKLMKGSACPDNVLIRVNENHIRIMWDGYILESKLIDGTYPDFTRVIPQNNDKTLSVDSAELLGALNAVTKVSSAKGRAVKFQIKTMELNLSVNNPESGKAAMPIDCSFTTPEKEKPDDGIWLEIGFNAGYLATIIKTHYTGKDSGTIKFELADPGSPARITGGREGLTTVLMPMRI